MKTLQAITALCCLTALVTACKQESNYPYQTDYLPIQLVGSQKWSIIDVNTGDVLSDINDEPMSKEAERLLHQTIKKVTEDIDSLSYNTAISQLMIFLNEFSKMPKRNRKAMETFVLLLSPMAPHIAEELWQRLGHNDTLAYAPWPKYDEAKLKLDEIQIVVQINGKTRARIMVPADADKDALLAIAKAADEVKPHIDGKTIVKESAVPARLINIVVK